MYESACLANGGQLGSGYFQLLDLEISELLYHLSIFEAVHQRINKQTADDKASNWAGGEMEWEKVDG